MDPLLFSLMALACVLLSSIAAYSVGVSVAASRNFLQILQLAEGMDRTNQRLAMVNEMIAEILGQSVEVVAGMSGLEDERQ